MALALFGLALDARLSFFIHRSRRRLRASGRNGIRLAVNRTRQRGRNGHLLAFLALALIGILAMLTPQPVRGVNQDSSSVAAVLLIALLLRMLYDTLRDSLDRESQLGQIVVRLLEEQVERHE